jgi:hypothetical protein
VQGRKPSARVDFAFATHERLLYLFGGNADDKLLNDLYSFNLGSSNASWNHFLCFHSFANHHCLVDPLLPYATPDTSTWTLIEPLGRPPTGRDRHTITYTEGKLFVFGGRSADAEYLNDLHEYDIATNKWSILFPGRAPIPRYHHTASVINGKLVIFGGKSNSGTGCFNDIHVFDPSNKQWVQVCGRAWQIFSYMSICSEYALTIVNCSHKLANLSVNCRPPPRAPPSSLSYRAFCPRRAGATRPSWPPNPR